MKKIVRKFPERVTEKINLLGREKEKILEE